MTSNVAGSGTASDPWILSTPPGRSDFEAWRDPDSDPAALVVQVGSTQLRYQLRCIDDLHAMLKDRGDWVPLGNADEQKPAADGTVEAWGRSGANPVGWQTLCRSPRRRNPLMRRRPKCLLPQPAGTADSNTPRPTIRRLLRNRRS